MSRRKYKSRKTYINARKRKEYNRYKREFRQKRSKLEVRGLTPYDSLELSYTEYFAVKQAKKKEGSVNPLRDIIQSQLYKYSYKSSVLLKKYAREYDADFSGLSLGEIRTGQDFDLNFLSYINDDLKEQFPTMTGKERAKFIRTEVFGYAD